MQAKYINNIAYWKFSIGPQNIGSLADKATKHKTWDCSVKTTKGLRELHDWTSFTDAVKEALDKLPLTTDKPKFAFSPPWVNVYEQGDYQDPHNHLNGTEALSYCYLHTLPDNSGKFAVFNPLYSEYNHGKFYTAVNLNTLGIEQWIYPDVQQHDLIVFPAFVLHKVTVHKAPKARVTVSGNVRIV